MILENQEAHYAADIPSGSHPRLKSLHSMGSMAIEQDGPDIAVWKCPQSNCCGHCISEQFHVAFCSHYPLGSRLWCAWYEQFIAPLILGGFALLVHLDMLVQFSLFARSFKNRHIESLRIVGATLYINQDPSIMLTLRPCTVLTNFI
eukprot:768155-Amphidinium_carterae.1